MSVAIEKIFLQILDMSMMASYCILAVLALRWLFRKAPKRYSYLLWIVVAFRLVCPLSIDSTFSIFNLNLVPEVVSEALLGAEIQSDQLPEPGNQNDQLTEAENQNDQLAEPKNQNGHLSENDPTLNAGMGSQGNIGQGNGDLIGASQTTGVNFSTMNQTDGVNQGTANQQDSSHVEANDRQTSSRPGTDNQPGDDYDQAVPGREAVASVRWSVIGSWAWAGGIVALAGFMMISWLRLKSQIRFAVKVKNGVYEADGIHSAFVLGVMKPKIYLPVGLTKEEQSWILLHENCHKWRRDYLIKMIASILTIIYWFNPLIWVAWSCFCRDMEMSCDEMALEGASQEMRKAYSRTLLSVASDRKVSWHLTPAFGENSVKSRIKHVLSFKKPAVWAGGVFAVILVVMLVVFGTNGKADENRETVNGAGETVDAGLNGDSGENGAGNESYADDETRVNSGLEAIGTENVENNFVEATPENWTEMISRPVWDYDSAEGDGWIELAWDAFEKQTWLDWTQDDRGDFFKRVPIRYTGFLDAHPWMTGYTLGTDYDGDGTADRVFQRYVEEDDRHEVYLFFGSGELLKLENNVHTNYWIDAVDLTGDGQVEIIFNNFIYYEADGGEETNVSIYEKKDGAWGIVQSPYIWGEEQEIWENRGSWSSFFSTDFVLMRIDGQHLRIIHPNSEKTITCDILGHAYRLPEVGETEESAVEGSTYSIYYDSESGCSKIRCYGKVGVFTLIWDLSYQDSQWAVDDFIICGFPTVYNRSLNMEKTEANLTSHASVEEVLGTSGQSCYIRLDQEGQVTINFDQEFAFYKGWAELVDSEEWTRTTVHADLDYTGESSALPEAMEIYWLTEDGTEYLVTEYNGEKLYWDTVSREPKLGRSIDGYLSFDGEAAQLLCEVTDCTEKEDGYYFSGNLYWEMVFPEETRDTLNMGGSLYYEQECFGRKTTKQENVLLLYQSGVNFVYREPEYANYGYVLLQDEVVNGEKTGRVELVGLATGERVALKLESTEQFKVTDKVMMVNADGSETSFLEFLENGGDWQTVEGLTVRSYPQ